MNSNFHILPFLAVVQLRVSIRTVMRRMAPEVRQNSCATFVVALCGVLFKYFAVRSDYWGVTFWTFVGEAIFGAGILAVPAYRRQFEALLRSNTSALLSISGANELINLGGGLGVRFASLLAPVAVVSAISSTTTLFVFAFGALLSWFAPAIAREDLSRNNLLRKGFAAAVAATGVVLAS